MRQNKEKREGERRRVGGDRKGACRAGRGGSLTSPRLRGEHAALRSWGHFPPLRVKSQGRRLLRYQPGQAPDVTEDPKGTEPSSGLHSGTFYTVLPCSFLCRQSPSAKKAPGLGQRRQAWVRPGAGQGELAPHTPLTSNSSLVTDTKQCPRRRGRWGGASKFRLSCPWREH